MGTAEHACPLAPAPHQHELGWVDGPDPVGQRVGGQPAGRLAPARPRGQQLHLLGRLADGVVGAAAGVEQRLQEAAEVGGVDGEAGGQQGGEQEVEEGPHVAPLLRRVLGDGRPEAGCGERGGAGEAGFQSHITVEGMPGPARPGAVRHGGCT